MIDTLVLTVVIAAQRRLDRHHRILQYLARRLS